MRVGVRVVGLADARDVAVVQVADSALVHLEAVEGRGRAEVAIFQQGDE